MRTPKAVVCAFAILQSEQLGAGIFPSRALLPQLRWEQGRHDTALATDILQMQIDYLLNPLQNSQTQGKQREQAAPQRVYHASTKH